MVRFALSASLSSVLFKNCTILWIFALHCKKYGCLSFTCTEFLDLWVLLSLVLAVAKLSNRNLHRMRFCGNICYPINLFIFDNAFCILALEFMAHLNILPRKIPFLTVRTQSNKLPGHAKRYSCQTKPSTTISMNKAFTFQVETPCKSITNFQVSSILAQILCK